MSLPTAGALLEAYFRLGIETHTTDLVLLEVRPSVAAFVLTGQLRVKTITGTEMAALLAFKAQQPPGLSKDYGKHPITCEGNSAPIIHFYAPPNPSSLRSLRSLRLNHLTSTIRASATASK